MKELDFYKLDFRDNLDLVTAVQNSISVWLSFECYLNYVPLFIEHFDYTDNGITMDQRGEITEVFSIIRKSLFLPFVEQDKKCIPYTYYLMQIDGWDGDSLILDKNQCQAVSQACDLFCRLGLGQFREIFMHFDRELKFDFDEQRDIEWKFKKILMPELEYNSSYGIGCDKVNRYSNIACDIHQTIRHRLSWDRVGNPPERDWKTMMTVNFDPPLGHSGVELPVIERIRKGDK